MTADWPALDRAIDGDVRLPDTPAYERSYKGFNARYHHIRPQAIVACAHAHDVAETINFVTRHGLRHAARSGGHCFAGHSSTNGVLIDTHPISDVSVADGIATVGAGARLGEVYGTLDDHGLTIAGGTCPPVGIAGLTLGGGLGILGRTYGTTADRLLRAQIVLADGRVLDCDDDHHADLFWALRGAGAGNFGVVTSFVFRAVPAPHVTNFHAGWSFPAAAAVIDAWQHWAPSASDQLAASLKVTSTGAPDRPPSVDVYGAFLGSEREAAALLDQLIVRADWEPTSTWNRPMTYQQTRAHWAHLEPGQNELTAPSEIGEANETHLVSKSEFFRRPLPSAAIGALLGELVRAGAGGESRELDFMPWGGAYNRRRPDETAFVHRRELFLLKHSATIDPAQSRHDEQAEQWVRRSWATVHAWGSRRVFQNFADPELDDWPTAYYGPNFPRLTRIKARYDPADAFRSEQSIPVRQRSPG
jgi:FAD/FMN-containing dehydrogenase